MRDICIVSAISLSFSQCLFPWFPSSLLDDDMENAKRKLVIK